MIQLGTIMKVLIKHVSFHHMYKNTGSFAKKRIAFLGDVVIVSVQWINLENLQI